METNTKDYPDYRYTRMNLDNEAHINIITHSAKRNLFLISPNYLSPTDNQQQIFVNNMWVPLA